MRTGHRPPAPNWCGEARFPRFVDRSRGNGKARGAARRQPRVRWRRDRPNASPCCAERSGRHEAGKRRGPLSLRPARSAPRPRRRSGPSHPRRRFAPGYDPRNLPRRDLHRRSLHSRRRAADRDHSRLASSGLGRLSARNLLAGAPEHARRRISSQYTKEQTGINGLDLRVTTRSPIGAAQTALNLSIGLSYDLVTDIIGRPIVSCFTKRIHMNYREDDMVYVSRLERRHNQ